MGPLFRYTGQILDEETELYYYKARYYSPALGRFLQTDPTGQTTFTLKITADAIIGGGIGGGFGVFFNPGTDPGEDFDFGITGSLDIADGNPEDIENLRMGFDISIGIEGGLIDGSAENLSGRARNFNAGAGLGLGASGTISKIEGQDGETVTGLAIAVEASPAPISGSTTVSQGFKYGFQDALKKVIDEGEDIFLNKD